MDTGGSNVRRLTTIGATQAVWSRDGKRVAFISQSGQKIEGANWLQVFVMDADGNNLRMVTTTANSKFEPGWSPDGTNISFTVERMGTMANVFQIGVDGNNLKRLTAGPTFDGHPAYAPDGSKLAFVSNRDGNPEIYVRSLR
jgi:Tol biopolymer transport system component